MSHPALDEIAGGAQPDAGLLRRMVRAKVPLGELIEALEGADHPICYSDLLDAGFTSRALCLAEAPLHDVWDELDRRGRFSKIEADAQRRERFLTNLKQDGWAAGDVASEGIRLEDMLRAGYDPLECFDATRTTGFLEAITRVRIAEKGFNPDHWKMGSHLEPVVKECRKAGIDAVALDPVSADFKANMLVDAGYTVQDVFACGYSARQAVMALSLKDCWAAGYSADALRSTGKSAKDLASVGVPPNEIVSVYVKRDAEGLADPEDARKLLEEIESCYPLHRRSRVKALVKVWARAEAASTTFEEVEQAFIDLQKLAASRYRMEVAQKKVRKDVDPRSLRRFLADAENDIERLGKLERTTTTATRKQKIHDQVAKLQQEIADAKLLLADLDQAEKQYEDQRDQLRHTIKLRRTWLKRQQSLEKSVTGKARSLQVLRQYDVAATASVVALNDHLAKTFYSRNPEKQSTYDVEATSARAKIHNLCVDQQGGHLFTKLDHLHQQFESKHEMPDFPVPPDAAADTAFAKDVQLPRDLRTLNGRLASWNNLRDEFDVESQLLDLILHTEKRAHKAYGGVVPMKKWLATLTLLGDSITTAGIVPSLVRSGIKSIQKGHLDIDPLQKRNSTGSLNFGVNFGFSYGEVGKLTAGISMSGALRIDDDRRLRANLTISLSVGVEVSPPSVKFLKFTIKAGLAVFNRTYAFADERHFAYAMALHLARIKAARELYDEMPDERVLLRSQKYTDLVHDTFLDVIGGSGDAARDEALSYLAHRPVIKVGAAGTRTIDTAFSDDLTGIEVTGSYSFSPKTFTKEHTFLTKGSKPTFVEEYKQGTVRNIGPFTVSGTMYLNATFSFTFADIQNDANPDNDGRYLTLTVPGTKYLPGGINISAPSPPTDYSNHAISQFKDASKFSGWKDLVGGMAPGVSSVGIDSNSSVNGVINWVYPPTHRNFAVVQYMRMEHSTGMGFQVGFGVETGAGEVGLDVGASFSHSIAMSERLGHNTLTYVQTVFNGLIARHKGDLQWQAWMADHRSDFFHIFKRIGKEGTNVRDETQSIEDAVNAGTEIWKDPSGPERRELRFLADVADDDGTKYGYGELHRLEKEKAASFVTRHLAVYAPGTPRQISQDGPDPIGFVEHCTKARASWGKQRFKAVKGSKEYADACKLMTTLFARHAVVSSAEGKYAWRRRRVSLSPAVGKMRASIAFDHDTGRWFLVKAPLLGGFSAMDVWSNEGFVRPDSPDGVERWNLRTYYDAGVEITLSIRSHRRDEFMYRGKIVMETRLGTGWEDLEARIRNLVLAVAKDPLSRSGFRVSHLKGKNSKPWHRATQLNILVSLHPYLSKEFTPFRTAFNAWGDRIREKKWYSRIPADEKDRRGDELKTLADQALGNFAQACRQAGLEDPMSAVHRRILLPVPAFRHDKAFWQKGPLDRTTPNDSLRFADVDGLLVKRVSAEMGGETPDALL